MILQGIPVSNGIGMGQGWVPLKKSILFNQIYSDTQLNNNPQLQKKYFLDALELARQELFYLYNSPEYQFLAEIYNLILDSASFKNTVLNFINNNYPAFIAIQKTIFQYKLNFESLNSDYFQERASELLTIEQTILKHLASKSKQRSNPDLSSGLSQNLTPCNTEKLPSSIILVLEDLSIASLLSLPTSNIKGIIASKGNVNSHIAILARNLGIPAILGVSNINEYYNQLLSQNIKINGHTGEISIYQSLQDGGSDSAWDNSSLTFLDPSLRAQRSNPDSSQNKLPSGLLRCARKDGSNILDYLNSDILINISSIHNLNNINIENFKNLGIKGIGLYRTEIDFMRFDQFPTESEQIKIYYTILNKFKAYPVYIRMLDLSEDKALPYFNPQKIEDRDRNRNRNRDRGKDRDRGLRILLNYPDIFVTQVRALLKANRELNNLRIILPMVETISELDKAIELINTNTDKSLNAKAKCCNNITFPLIGLMIETLPAVEKLSELITRVDFISIGTNDLIPNILNIDRDSVNLNIDFNNNFNHNLSDYLNSDIIKTLDYIIKTAHAHHKKVILCGEIASDPRAFEILSDLKFDSVSVNIQALHSGCTR